jgi:hypothetical protein
MCNFFAFVTEPEQHGGKRYYFDWEWRKEHLQDENDSHSTICKHYSLDEDKCNKYEYNPLTREFTVDQINSPVDDTAQAHEWADNLDFKRIVEPLIIKPIVNPLELPAVTEITEQHIIWLKEWASVWDSVWASVGDSVWASVWASVWVSVWDSVGASVGASVWDSVWASVWAYISSFFAIDYEYDLSPAINLWHAGLVPSHDGETWRLHTGRQAKIVYEWRPTNV